MKLTKGKKQEEKEKKKLPEPPKPPAKIPEPPGPVRIQVEPRKASTVSVEVKSETKPKNANVRKKPASSTQSKPVKSVEISTEKRPSVTVSIFDSAAPAKPKKGAGKKAKPRKTRKPSLFKREKIEMETDKIPLISKPSRIKAYEKPSSVRISDSSGTVTEGDLKFIRDFIAKSGYLYNQVAEVRIGLSKIAKFVDMFTEKVNSTQKDVGELKMKMASLKEWKIEKDVSELKERTDEIEAVLEKMSDKFREYKAESEKSGLSESKRMRSVSEEISGLKAGVKELRERMLSLNTELTKLGDFKAFVQAKAKEPQKEAAPDAIKNITDRFDTFDSRITGVNDRIVRMSEDLQKLTSYFMEGIKHLESRIKALETEKEVEGLTSRIPEPEPKFTATTYRSHLKREPEPEEEMDLDEEDYEKPERRFIPRGSRVAMPLPPPAVPMSAPDFGRGSEGRTEERRRQQAPPAEPPFNQPSPYANLPPVSSPPPAPAPERGNMFTKLRESTVIRRPIPQEDPDMDILLEHIRESIQKQESREKITRDLLNTGFDQDIINKAFLRYRVA
jgi:predicted  nucleic acid-binding Zn-ribbon protein